MPETPTLREPSQDGCGSVLVLAPQARPRTKVVSSRKTASFSLVWQRAAECTPVLCPQLCVCVNRAGLAKGRDVLKVFWIDTLFRGFGECLPARGQKAFCSLTASGVQSGCDVNSPRIFPFVCRRAAPLLVLLPLYFL